MSMVEVTKDQFFKAVGGPENIHPSSHPDHSSWEIVGTRTVVGRTEPGYKCRDKDGNYTSKKNFWLTKEFAARKGINVPLQCQDRK
ncbi:hypothetical protein ATN89_17630 [Comamonas thiooxydans]|uniref:hypothetical protein n=1 Tax=Comamonas thiooxydans TaxID=363952 RepID=UPI0007C57D1B|nr:hypothetical protein [Comamonas thiooxydans]OAD82903.1 hypothetical protein ATN89_17630 [Comamonas thiooxydans]